jgi:hypothetical protein
LYKTKPGEQTITAKQHNGLYYITGNSLPEVNMIISLEQAIEVSVAHLPND